MNSWKRVAPWTVLILAGLAAVFLLSNFRVAKSTTRVDSQISTFGSGFEQGESLPANAPLSLVVEGQDSLARMAAKRIERTFLDGPITRVDRELAVQSDMDQFQVVVRVTSKRMIWSPVFAQSTLDVNFSFSSNGDLSWRDQEVVGFSSEQGQVVAVSGDIQLVDTTYGLFTLPAYQTYLADELAWRIDEAIRKALASPTNPALIDNP